MFLILRLAEDESSQVLKLILQREIIEYVKFILNILCSLEKIVTKEIEDLFMQSNNDSKGFFI